MLLPADPVHFDDIDGVLNVSHYRSKFCFVHFLCIRLNTGQRLVTDARGPSYLCAVLMSAKPAVNILLSCD